MALMTLFKVETKNIQITVKESPKAQVFIASRWDKTQGPREEQQYTIAFETSGAAYFQALEWCAAELKEVSK